MLRLYVDLFFSFLVPEVVPRHTTLPVLIVMRHSSEPRVDGIVVMCCLMLHILPIMYSKFLIVTHFSYMGICIF